jgi:hypothetical protein
MDAVDKMYLPNPVVIISDELLKHLITQFYYYKMIWSFKSAILALLVAFYVSNTKINIFIFLSLCMGIYFGTFTPKHTFRQSKMHTVAVEHCVDYIYNK